jgi:arylsulfatase A-like enzyme
MNIVRAAIRGGLWGAAICVVEALVLERWFDIGMRRASFVPEVGLNGLIYGALVGAAIALGMGIVSARARSRRPVTVAVGGGRRQILADEPPRVEPVHAVSAVTALLFSGAAAATLLHAHAGWNGIFAMLLAVAIAMTVGALAYVLSNRRGGLLEIFLVMVVLITSLWSPMATAVARPDGGEGDRPNVVLVCVDNARADFVSAYGCEWATTPTLDSLAAVGTRFERAVAAASWGLPATASLHTSTFPSHHGATSPERGLRDEPRRLAEVLADAGYRTGAFSENRFVTPRFGFGEGFDSFWAYDTPWVFDHLSLYRRARAARLPLASLSRKRDREPETPHDLNWDADVTLGEMAAWIDDVEGPFFAYAHVMGPHTPYGAPEFLLSEARPSVAFAYPPDDRGGAYPLGPVGEVVADEALLDLELLYASDVAYVDRAIGRLMATLRSRGLADGTIVIVTSDHGEEFYEHNGWGHGASTYQEVVRVPLVIAGPGVNEHVVNEVVRTIDVAPTVLDLVGLDSPAGFQGRTLGGAVRGEALEPVPALVEGVLLHPWDSTSNALVTRFHSLVEVSHAGVETAMLFDLTRDPFEREDLTVAQPSLADSLKRELLTWRQRAAAGGADGSQVRLDGDTEDALRSLGYVN